MRTVAGILISGVLGVALAMVATTAIASRNAPDRAVETRIESIKTGELKPADVVQYGQR